MIAALIRWSLANRFLVLLASLLITAGRGGAAAHAADDALPDLSDTQVIIRTSWPGRRRRSSRTRSPTR